jgi:methionine aminotransferase
MIALQSKLPKVQTSIFTQMSALAQQQQAINLSQGFPNFEGDPLLYKLVHQAMQQGHNQYAPMAGLPALTERLAAKIESLYGRSLQPESEITITAGATQALFTAITSFVRAGEEVIIIEPAYDSYKPAIELCGAIAIPFALEAPDFRIDWQKLARYVSVRTRMIILNSPHNPTATVFTEADWLALERIAHNTDILLLCDEVYEHLTYDGKGHESVLKHPRLFQRSIACFSFGKTFHNTGWKMGYCVAPAYLMKEFRKVHQFNVFSVNTPMQYALAEYLQAPEHYLQLPDFYQQKRDFFRQALQGSAFKLLPCEGTYFQLLDYSAISQEKDVDFAIRLTKEHGIATIPVSVFYSQPPDMQLLRVCFAKTEETLGQAAEKLKAVGG